MESTLIYLQLNQPPVGHAGHETVNYVSSSLPNTIQNALANVILHDHTPDAAAISNVLTSTIASFDEEIGRALLTLFPDPEALAKLSDEEIRSIINDGGSNSTTVLRCMLGSTVLISLVNPSRTSLWTASLGDCAAGMTRMLSRATENGTFMHIQQFLGQEKHRAGGKQRSSVPLITVRIR